MEKEGEKMNVIKHKTIWDIKYDDNGRIISRKFIGDKPVQIRRF